MPRRKRRRGFGGWLAAVSATWPTDSKLDNEGKKYRGWMMNSEKLAGSVNRRSIFLKKKKREQEKGN